MELSVVVPTLNAEAALSECLDALAAVAPDAERIVVDGPSADGTSGMVAGRDDVSVLVELADRSVNTARNAGIAAATGDVIAFVDGFTTVDGDWREALEAAFADGAAVVTGPVRRREPVGLEDDGPERRRIGGRDVTYFDGGNVAFDADLVRRLDGFDEYLPIGGAREAAHRIAGLAVATEWVASLAAERAASATRPTAFDWKYRSLGYRLAKNYGPKPAIVWRAVRQALGEAAGEFRAVREGERPPSQWLGDGRDVTVNLVRGVVDGCLARRRDRSPARNPHGISSRDDRAVHLHDWR